MTPEEWDKTLNINLQGMFFCTQRAAKEMVRQGDGGKIVNLGSVHGFAAVPNHAHYEASKGGINLFTKACAIELAPNNIQVNAIAPGAIEVERYHAFEGYNRDEWGTRIPAGRVGWPSDIGPLAAFLCSEGELYHRPDHLGRWQHDQPARGDPPVTSAENRRSAAGVQRANGTASRARSRDEPASANQGMPMNSRSSSPGSFVGLPARSSAMLAGCAVAPSAPARPARPARLRHPPPSRRYRPPPRPSRRRRPWPRSPDGDDAPTVPTSASPTAVPASPTAPAPTAAPSATAVAVQPATFSAEAAYRHVEALAVEIGVRAAGTEGERRAAVYIDEQLASSATASRSQPFPITSFRDGGSTLTATGLQGSLLATALRYSGGGAVDAPVILAGQGTLGDFAQGAARGKIALIERGAGLTFQEKAANAKAAGAAAVVIYNNVDGSFTGGLSGPYDLPAVSLSRADGLRLRQAVEQRGPIEASLRVDAVTERPRRRT